MEKQSFQINESRKKQWPKVVWISGASSGLGLHTAKAMVSNRFTVIAGARSFGQEKTIEGCHCLPLDVTDPVSIDGFSMKQ